MFQEITLSIFFAK